jgi:hypothetical protein
MGNRVTFLAGFAAGFVVGTRAGRERYDQMVNLGRKAVEHPAVQNAGRTAGSKANDLTNVAKQKAAESFPKIAETVRSSASRSKAGARTSGGGAGTGGGQLNQTPDRTSSDDVSPAGNGNRRDE